MRKIGLNLIMLIGVIAFLSSCQKDELELTKIESAEYSSTVVIDWIGLTLQLTEETPGFTPPVAARVYGYTGLALYEGVRYGMPEFKSLQGQLTDFIDGMIPSPQEDETYHWAAVANTTLSVLLKSFFQTASPINQSRINELKSKYENQFRMEASEEIIERSIKFGEAVGNAVLSYAQTDGQSECYKFNFPNSYMVPVGEGMWEPTSPSEPIPLQPYWGEARPFMQANVSELPAPPPPYSTDPSSDFYAEVMEVYEAVNNLTPEEKVIAEFWSDDPGNTATPPGHSYSIMMQVLSEENADLARTAEVYAKLGMGIHDAFVSCWKAKYHYNLVRPITYIHKYIDDTWAIPLATPPFPEYTSGHSVQSGAAAKILTDLFGDDYSFVDRTHIDRSDIDGSPRSFKSFYEFADEASISRLYGGIHYRAGIDVGKDQGIKVGQNIGKLEFK